MPGYREDGDKNPHPDWLPDDVISEMDTQLGQEDTSSRFYDDHEEEVVRVPEDGTDEYWRELWGRD